MRSAHDLRSVAPVRLRVATVIAALVAASFALAAIAVPRPALGASTLLDIAEGEVFVRRAALEVRGRDGQPLAEGDEVRTGDDGRAVVIFFDGSTLSLDPSTTVRIEAARTRSGATVIEVFQTLGSTWHAVNHLLDPGSRYEVRTPSLSAAVRGTAFQVTVGEENDEVTTEEGTVEVHAQESAVRVTRGERTLVRHGDRPRPPESAPRPPRVLRVELVGGSGAIVDRSRRAVGVTLSGELRNAIPGARVERIGDGVVVIIPNPTRDLRFVAGPGLTTVRYALLDQAGQVVVSGESTPTPGSLSEAFERLRNAFPSATPTLRPRIPSPSPTRAPLEFATLAPRLTFTPSPTSLSATPPPSPLPSPTLSASPAPSPTLVASPPASPSLSAAPLPSATFASTTPLASTPAPTLAAPTPAAETTAPSAFPSPTLPPFSTPSPTAASLP